MAVATPHSIERSSVIISVFSTTPGIGKTITAINLAAGLAHEGYKVCLADLDLQFGDVLNYLKLSSTNTIAGAQRALLDHPDKFHVRDFLIDYSHEGLEFSIMPAPLYIYDAYQTDVQLVTDIINDLNFFDYVILDLNSMFSALNLAMLDISTVINYVGVIDFLPALKNYKIGYDTLIRFEYEESKIRLVENRADSQKLIDGRRSITDCPTIILPSTSPLIAVNRSCSPHQILSLLKVLMNSSGFTPTGKRLFNPN